MLVCSCVFNCPLHGALTYRAKATPPRSSHCLRPQGGATIQRPGWAGEHIGFMPFPVGRILRHDDCAGLLPSEAARARKSLRRATIPAPVFRCSAFKKRDKPVSAVEVVAVVLKPENLGPFDPLCVPEIVYLWEDSELLAMSLFVRDPGKSRHIADIVGSRV